jgi:3-hydroxyacyl-CoA dehydrogenase
MHVSVVDSGYVGTTVAACLAVLEHDVVAVDIDEAVGTPSTTAAHRFTNPASPNESNAPPATACAPPPTTRHSRKPT